MMDYKNLTKKEIVEILDNIKHVLNGDIVLYNNKIKKDSSIYSNVNSLENLIGTIPFILLNKTIFEKNQDIAEFANRIGIEIPTPEKKKREDIIGRIIAAIAEFDKLKVEEINEAIKALKKTDIKKGKSNFFKDWENVIKDMNI